MSYLALVTDRFDEVVQFYGERLHFPIVDRWERANARGLRFDLGGMRLEILDNGREPKPLSLGQSGDRVHVVVEVEDIEDARQRIDVNEAPQPQLTSWGARLFQLRDPDGVPVTFLQWISSETGTRETIRGRVVSGAGKGKYFTNLEWARRQFNDKLQFDPFAGTLNLEVEDPQSQLAWHRVRDLAGVRIENPNQSPKDCDARCYPVSIEGRLDGAIVLPEVENYSTKQIEIVSAIGLRDALGIHDGDLLTLEVNSR